MAIEINVKCMQCRESLDVEIVYTAFDVVIKVDSCSKCLSDARKEGYDEGYEVAEDTYSED